MTAFPVTIAFTAGTFFGIALMIGLYRWLEWRTDRDDRRDYGDME